MQIGEAYLIATSAHEELRGTPHGLLAAVYRIATSAHEELRGTPHGLLAAVYRMLFYFIFIHPFIYFAAMDLLFRFFLPHFVCCFLTVV